MNWASAKDPSSVCALWLLLSVSVGTAVAAGSEGSERARIVDASRTRIENGLKPLVVVTNHPRGDFSLDGRMRHYNVPGVGIAVIDAGEVAWSKGYGIADKETARLVGPETAFRAASISKPVAAAGALVLVARGTLSLDSNADEYMTSWRLPECECETDVDVTLRHLLSHSSGLTDDPGFSFRQDQAIPTLIQVLDGTTPATSEAVRADTAPGAAARYSNQGFCVVELMMSDTTRRPFAALMHELVLEPLGMDGSTFCQDMPQESLSRVATGYRSTGEELPGKRLICPALAAAGLWSTPSDLAQFLLAIMRSFDGDETALLSKDYAEEMLTVQAGKYGLGLTLEGTGDDLRFSHGGASDGYRCFMVAYPGRGQGAVIMTNSDAGQGLYYEILRGVAGELGWPGYQATEKTVVHPGIERLKEYEGTYLLDGRIELQIRIEEDHLLMATPSSSYSFYAESNMKFFDIDFGMTIDFTRNGPSSVSGAVLNRGGVLSTLSRVD